MSKREIGKQRIKEILGEKSENIIKILESISPDFANYVLDFAYGDLSMQDSLVVLMQL